MPWTCACETVNDDLLTDCAKCTLPRPKVMAAVALADTPINISPSTPEGVSTPPRLPPNRVAPSFIPKPLAPKTTPTAKAGPVGGQTEGNKSSAVPVKQLDAFVEGLLDKPGMGFPMFTISECNSFHTSGYLWSLYAAKKLLHLGLPPGPIAIVNFDQHADRDAPTTPCVASDRWGVNIINSLKALGMKAVYLSVFNTESGKIFAVAPGKVTDSMKTLVSGGDFKGFWQEAADALEVPAFRYVFVTIDRDVMVSNYTQWGDGHFRSYGDLVSSMRNVLTPLFLSQPANASAAVARGPLKEGESPARNVIDTPKPYLIGFDITGLPEQPGFGGGKTPSSYDRAYEGSQYSETFLVDYAAAVWPSLNSELAEFLSFASDWPIPENTRIEKLVLFTGSVSLGFGYDMVPKMDCWEFMAHLAGRLAPFLGENWRYLLNRQKAPAFIEGWKPMFLYSSAKPLIGAVTRKEVALRLGPGQDVGGFACTASVAKPGIFDPVKVSISDMEELKGRFAVGAPVEP